MADRSYEHEVGVPAPDFTLKDQEGKDIKLSDQKGKRVLLSFHPLAWTGVCTDQMQAIEDNYEIFESLNTLPLGMSCDPVPSKRAWTKYHNWKKIRLPSDFWPHGEVSSLYKIFRQKDGFSERANIIVDEKGIITFFKTYPLSHLPEIDEIIDILKKM